MTTMTEVKPAIARSISHNEIIWLEVDNPESALDAIDNDENVTELDWTKLDWSDERGECQVLDVWGKRLGESFRLHIRKV